MPKKLKIEKQSDGDKKPFYITDIPAGPLVIDRDVFLAALEKVKHVVKAKSILPILNNVLIEFAPGLITVTATDLELTVIVTIPGGFDLAGSCAFLLPGELLRNTLSKMKEGDVVVSFPGDNLVTLIQDAYEITFPEIRKDDFPEVAGLETGEQILTIEGKQYATAINKVIYGVSKDETRYALTGVALMISDEELFTIGTDGFRISVYKTAAEAARDLPATIIPRRAAKLAADLLDIDGIVQVRLGRNDKAEITTLIFDAPNLLISTRVINQAYPDWRQLLSFEPAVESRLCTVSTSYMLECLERIGIVAGKDAAAMVIAPGRVSFVVESGIAKAKSWIPATVNFSGAEYHVVVGQFADAFGHIGTDRANMIIPETYGMIKITERPEKDGPARHIQGIMPWRV